MANPNPYHGPAPDPPLSPNEKLYVPRVGGTLPSSWERDLRLGGVDPDMARKLSRAFQRYESQGFMDEVANIHDLQYWANIHTHDSGVVGPAPGCPSPWAWYHGDDLVALYSEGDEVRLWPDRISGRDLTDYLDPTATNYPLYTANAVGGRPGISQNAPGGEDLAVVYDNVELSAITIMIVEHNTDNGSVGMNMSPTDPAKFSAQMYSYSGGFLEAVLADGYAEINATGTAQTDRMVMGVGRNPATLYVNGVEGTDFQEPVTEPVNTFRTVLEITRLSSATTPGRVAELKIWDSALSDACVQSEWDRVREEYSI